MHVTVKSGHPEAVSTACLIVAVFEGGKLSAAAQAVDKASQGAVKALFKSGDLKGKVGQTVMLHHPAGLACDRLLLVGCGKEQALDDAAYHKMVKAALSAARGSAAKEALVCLGELEVAGRDAAWKARLCTEVAAGLSYRYDQTKSKKETDLPSLTKLQWWAADAAEGRTAKRGIEEGTAIAAGMRLAKDLGNLPGNICTPTYLADQAKALGNHYKNIKVTVLDEKAMEKLGMGSLLSVSSGSRQPAKLIVAEYNGVTSSARKRKPVVLVGKGLTFDAGGISIKPGAGMDEMKYDMCGGASVLGTLKAIAELELPINVVGVVPASENLPDGNANKPGDIVTSMSGQTIEILNTDAEGRLILCDAITYAKRFDPEVLIDVATLTGACVIALGKHASGLLGNDQDLIDALLDAGRASGDRAWQLPLWPEYDEQLKSPFADMANVGGREAGTITGAAFIGRYTKELRWAHLDIAGTAWDSGANKGATGRPVPMLVQYLLNRVANKK